MAYELSVSEVGAAEYPLLEVLREAIFGDTGHVFHSTLAEDLEGRHDIFALIAHLEGNPVGFKVGYRFGPGVYYSKSGGVLKDYRRNGLARQMQSWQHGWLRARGYRKVFFNSFNRFKPMIRFGLDSGFLPIAAERQGERDLSFKFVKDLTGPDRVLEPPKAAETVQIDRATPQSYGLMAAMASLCGKALSEEQIDRELRSPSSLALLASLAGRPVGFVLGQMVDDREYTVQHFTVIDTYRQLGAEPALIDRLLTVAHEQGCDRIRWQVPHDDVYALRNALDASFDLSGILHDGPSGRTYIILTRGLLGS